MDLRRIAVESPCTAPWDAMTGDEARRRCESCDRDVHNLAAMRRDEVEQLLRARTGPICIRIARDRGGALHFADGPLVAPQRLSRIARAAAMTAALAACAPVEEGCPEEPVPQTMQTAVEGACPAPPPPHVPGDIPTPTAPVLEVAPPPAAPALEDIPPPVTSVFKDSPPAKPEPKRAGPARRKPKSPPPPKPDPLEYTEGMMLEWE